jgi:hypothetical protein
MKIALLISLILLPILAEAWDGDSYDYKLGRAENIKKDRVFETGTDELGTNNQNNFHRLSIEINRPFNLVIPDPKEFINIEAVPNYLWK